jgi:single-strand DNA-binding protein
MSQDNHITLRGYLTAEPRFHQKTSTAVPLTEIRIGSTPRRLNRETGEWQDAPTSYFTVKVWRRLAINAASSLHKGDMVVVRGKFYMNTWVDNQQRTRSMLEIEADSLGHDLAYGWSHFLRGSRPQSGRSAGVNEGEVARQDTETSDPDDGYDEYSAGNGTVESTEDSFALGGQTDSEHPGLTGEPSAHTLDTSTISITEGDDIGILESADALAETSLTSGSGLPESEVVPF